MGLAVKAQDPAAAAGPAARAPEKAGRRKKGDTLPGLPPGLVLRAELRAARWTRTIKLCVKGCGRRICTSRIVKRGEPIPQWWQGLLQHSTQLSAKYYTTYKTVGGDPFGKYRPYKLAVQVDKYIIAIGKAALARMKAEMHPAAYTVLVKRLNELLAVKASVCGSGA